MIRRFLTVAITALGLTLGAYGQAAAAKSKAADTKAAAKSKADTAKTQATGDLIDINTATEADLDAIPGIGKAYAKKIIDGRPYDNKSQLVSKKVLPQSVYNKVKDKIIAKQK